MVVDGQVPRLHHARRQPRARAASSRCSRCPAEARPRRRRSARLDRGARHLRRGAALRRRRDHAGHLGAQRGRGARGGDARRCSPSIVPLTCAHPVRALPASSSAAPRGIGAVFGPIMVVWFVDARRSLGRPAHRAAPGGPRGAEPASTPFASSPTHGWHGFARARRRRPRHHRRRGALRRHGALRAPPDPASPGSCFVMPALLAQLLRPGRARSSRDPAAAANPFFAMVPAARSSTRWSSLVDDGDDHRLAGADLRAPSRSRSRRCSSASFRA